MAFFFPPKRSHRSSHKPAGRVLRLESLENRELLSVSPALSPPLPPALSDTELVAESSFTIEAVPNAPTALTAVQTLTRALDADLGKYTQTFTWQDHSDDETKFEIQYSSDGGTNWTTTSKTANNTKISLFTKKTDSYLFKVRAYNASGYSDWSETLESHLELTKPNPPATFSALVINTSQVRMSWTAVDGAESYRLERSPGGCDEWMTVYSGTERTYTDTETEENTPYDYRLLAVNAQYESDPAKQSVTTKYTVLTAPTGITTAVVDFTNVIISWNTVKGATSYCLERSQTGNDGWSMIYFEADTSFTDTATAEDTTYYYRITAVSSATLSPVSGRMSATTGHPPVVTDIAVGLNSGVLRIDGTDDDDWVQIQDTGSQIVVHAFTPQGTRDTVLASYSKSQVSSIVFYGGNGDDTFKNWYKNATGTIACSLYGGAGNDYLMGGLGANVFDGGDGDNLLFGGTGTNTFTNTGLGSSCFVWRGSNDRWAEGSSNSSAGQDDAQLLFYARDSFGNTQDTYNGTTYDFRKWTDAEILLTLDAVQYVYQALGNYRFFRNERFTPESSYFCDAAQYLCITDMTGLRFAGLNSGSTIEICFPTIGYALDTDQWKQTVIHEFAHNWGITSFVQCNPFFEEFRFLSWSDGYSTKKGDSKSGDFARDYGQTNAHEDWATTIEAVLYYVQDPDATTERWYRKADLARQFLNYIGAHQDWGITSVVVDSDLDVIDHTDGVLTLREALLYAGNDTVITFAEELRGATITMQTQPFRTDLFAGIYMSGSPLSGSRNVTIDAAGMDITIDAAGTGGMFNHTSGGMGFVDGSGGRLTLIGLTLTGANGRVVDGGFRKEVVLIDVTMTGNTATLVGSSNSNITVINSTFVGNAGDAFYLNSGTVTIINSLIAGNGGTPFSFYRGEVNVYNSTIVGNGSPIGFSAYNASTVNLYNSIVYNNGSTNFATLGTTGSVTAKASFLGRLYDTAGMTLGSDCVYSTTTTINPRFVAYSSVTPWTDWDLHLLPDSPLLGKGKASLLPGGTVTDLDGNVRHTGGSVDPGAYQHSYVSGTMPVSFETTVTVSGVTANTATLNWTEPTADGYTIKNISYRVYVKLDNAADWTLITTTSGTTATLENLSPGRTHRYRIEAIVDGIEGFFIASDDIVTPIGPGAPVDLTYTITANRAVLLNWNDVSGGTHSFRVMKSTDGGKTWTVAGTAEAGTTSFTAAPTQALDHRYRIQAVDGTVFSDPSNEVFVTTAEFMAPKTPTGLTAVATPRYRNGQLDSFLVEYRWNDDPTVTQYRCAYSHDGGATWHETVTQTSSRNSLAVGSYVSFGDFLVRVRALNEYGYSEWTEIVTADVEPVRPSSPRAVSTSLTTQDGKNGIQIMWGTSAGAVAYRVERSTAGSGWQEIFTGTGQYYIDTDLQSSTLYYYRVTALGETLESDPSATVSRRSSYVSQSYEQLVVGVAGITEKTVSLTWNSIDRVFWYTVSRSSDGHSWKDIKKLDAGVTEYTDKSLKSGTTYYYRVYGFGSGFSEAQTVTTRLVAPGTPTVKVVGGDSINISWKTVTGATGYIVQRYENGDWVAVDAPATLAKTTWTLTDTGLESNTAYRYRVIATGDEPAVESTASKEKSATTPPGVTENLSVVAVTDKTATLTWQAVDGATKYKIEKLVNGKWKSAGTSKTTTATVKSLKMLTDYTFRVTAVGKSGTAAPSETVEARTVLPAPGAPSVKTLDSNSVNVTWKQVKTAAGYTLQRAVAGSEAWTDVATVTNAAKPSYVDTNLEPNTSYRYRLVSLGTEVTMNSNFSKISKTVTTAPATPPDFIIRQTTEKTVTLAWTAVTGATSYKVEKFVKGKWTSAGSSKTTEITIKSLKPDTEYLYRVVAVSKSGRSTPSTALAVTTLIASPPAPKNLKVSAVSENSLLISWSAASGAEWYRLERYDSTGRTWLLVIETTETSFTEDFLASKMSYSYRVTAVNSTGESKPSSKATGKTK